MKSTVGTIVGAFDGWMWLSKSIGVCDSVGRSLLGKVEGISDG